MYIDTNILMRYLLNDIPEQADKAAVLAVLILILLSSVSVVIA